jgi:transcriptional antiterminator NusG
MADNNVKKWYVVRAVSEEIVKAYIETEISRLEMEDYVSQFLFHEVVSKMVGN